jgi:hypothetical protein
MKNPIRNYSPRTKFILLQLVAIGLAFGTPAIVLVRFRWIWALLLCLIGVSLAIVGSVRCGRSGQGEWRLLASCILGYLVSLVCWIAVTIFLPELLGSRNWAALFYLQAPCLSAGSLVYFGLGPFRWRVAPRQVARDLIVGNRDLRLGGPARPEVVAKAELLLGLSLPTPFRDFLLDYGEIRGTAVTLLGLGPATDLDRPSTDDFVGATLDGRSRLGLPRGYVVCSAAAEGLMACLDTTAIETEIPVVLWNPATRSVVRVAAKNFTQYLIDTLRPKPHPR